MKILFIYPNNQKNNWRLPLGISYLIGILKKYNHNVILYDTTLNGAIDDNLLYKLKYFQPHLICISIMSTNITLSTKIISFIKEKFPKLKILVGGIHATISPILLLKNQDIDYLCLGEGEISLIKFIEEFENNNYEYYGEINGIWYKKDGNIIDRGYSDLETNLDILPFPDRQIFDTRHNLMISHGTPILTARGCPFNCSYCVNPIYKKIYKNNYIRFRSIENVIEEMREIIFAYNNDSFFIQDETFFMKKERVVEFCKIYQKEINIPFRCMGQVTQIDKEILEILKEAKCEGISIGIESGNENIRKNILKRDVKNEKIIEIFHYAKKLKIKIHSFNIIGLPLESRKEIDETLDLNIKAQPYSVQFTIMTPFEGTEIRKIYENNNCIIKNYVDSVYGDSMIKTDKFNSEELIKIQKIIPYRYYFHNKPILLFLSKLISNLSDKNKIIKIFKRIIKEYLESKIKYYSRLNYF